MIWVIIVWFLLIGFFLAAIGIWHTEPMSIVFGGIFMGLGLCFIILSPVIEAPSAIDVYRGKTTLKITYIDDVPVDSVVVFNYR